GYSDQDETRFQELFKEMMDNLDEDVQRGTVQQKDSYGLI
ncbi:type II secretion protein, partial [Staphylococcus epidermidis]|nr:type II secretion protein [Staphylococcus epidermidis]